MREFPGLAQTTRHIPACRQMGLLFLLLALLLLLLTACASNTGILGGGSWQASGLQNQHLQALAVDPNHLQDMYAGDAQAGVFASSDAGITWRSSSVGLPTPIAINALAFDLAGKKLYAATDVGLFVSRDSASSWSRVAGVPMDSYRALSFDVNAPQLVYVASEHSGVLMSRDDGINWTSASRSLSAGALTSVLYDTNQKNLWAASADTIYRSSDNGATWRAMTAGLPANVGINVLALGAVTSGNSDLIFAGTKHGFFLSSDAGQHWAQSQFSLASLNVSAVLLDASQPNVVYASTDIGVLRSNDSGQNWNQVASGLPDKQAFAGLVQGDVNYTQLFVASHGIYRYPGSSGSVLDPSRFIPIVLIILFFFLLYYFFVRRRRPPTRRSALRVDAPAEADASRSGAPSAENTLNGRYPSSHHIQDLPEDEKEES